MCAWGPCVIAALGTAQTKGSLLMHLQCCKFSGTEWSTQGHVIPCCGLGSRLEKGENPTNLAVNTAKGRKPGLEGNPRSAGTSAPQQGLGYSSEVPPCSWAPVLGGENRKMLPRSQAVFFFFSLQGTR